MDLRYKQVTVKLNKYNSLNAESFSELVNETKNKRVCIISENKCEYCFLYADRCARDVCKKKKQPVQYTTGPLFAG